MRNFSLSAVATVIMMLLLPFATVSASNVNAMPPVLLEQSLAAIGEYQGPIDGQIGPSVMAGLSRFESANHLPGNASSSQIEGTLVWALGHGHTLGMGSTGRRVELLQWRLNHLGYFAGPSDGLFGPKTASAVKNFQSQMGLAATGTVDDAVWSALSRFPYMFCCQDWVPRNRGRPGDLKEFPAA